MLASTDLLQQLVNDRQQELRASVAHTLVGSSPARTRIARTLRRAADRLDATTSPSAVSNALPGGGFEPPSGLSAL